MFTEQRILGWTVLLAFLVRVVFIAVFGGEFALTGDAGSYDLIAKNILDFGVFSKNSNLTPTALRTPIYPIFLAGSYAMFGRNFLVVQILQCVLSAATVWLLFEIAKRSYGRNVAYIALVISSVYPSFAFYASRLVTETLFVFFLVLCSLCFIVFRKNGSFFWWIGFCLSFSLGMMLRPVLIFFVPFLVFDVVRLYRNNFKRYATLLGTMVLVFFMLDAPWIIRNYQRFGEIVPFTTGGGYAFYGGNNPENQRNVLARGAWVDSNIVPDLQELYQRNEVERDRIFYARGFNFLQQNVAFIPAHLYYKFMNFWSLNGETKMKTIALVCSYGVLLPFFLFGLGLGIRRTLKTRDESFVFLSMIVAFNLAALVFYGSIRFRFPIEPFIILFSALGIEHLKQFFIHLRRSKAEIGG